MLSEFFSGKRRIIACCLMECGFCLGYLATSLFNLGLGAVSWRLMFLVGIAPAFLALYIRLRLKEPEQFKQVNEVRNSRSLSSKLSADELEVLNNPLKALFKAEYMKKTLVVTSLTAVAIVGYWAALSWIPAWINQLTGELAVTERSTAGIILNLSGVLACLVTYPLILMFGRKNTLKYSYLFSLLFTTGMFLFVNDYGPSLLSMIFAVGFFTSIPFVVLVIVIPELFATELLGSASGLAFSVGRVIAAAAALLSGQLITICDGSYAVAGATIGLVYGIGFLASWAMPESNGEVLGTSLGSATIPERIDSPEPIAH